MKFYALLDAVDQNVTRTLILANRSSSGLEIASFHRLPKCWYADPAAMTFLVEEPWRLRELSAGQASALASEWGAKIPDAKELAGLPPVPAFELD